VTIPPPEIINGLLEHGDPQSFAAFRHFMPVHNRIFRFDTEHTENEIGPFRSSGDTDGANARLPNKDMEYGVNTSLGVGFEHDLPSAKPACQSGNP
jgi:hypothetical protein